MAPSDDEDRVDADALLLAAARVGSELEALLSVLETRPSDWQREQYVVVWVRAARYLSDLVVLGAHVLQGLREAAPVLRRLALAVAVLVGIQAMLVAVEVALLVGRLLG